MTFASEKANLATEAKVENTVKRTMPVTAYQQDFATFQNKIEEAAEKAMSDATKTKTQNKEELQKIVIKDSEMLTQSMRTAVFKTPEGKKLQADFIAFNNDGIQLLLSESKWRNDQALQEQLIQKSVQLHQNLIQAIADLQTLTEE